MEKDFFWSEIGRIRIWRTGRFTPTKNSQEYPPPRRQMQKWGLGLLHLNGAKNVLEIFNSKWCIQPQIKKSCGVYISPRLGLKILYSMLKKKRRAYSLLFDHICDFCPANVYVSSSSSLIRPTPSVLCNRFGYFPALPPSFVSLFLHCPSPSNFLALPLVLRPSGIHPNAVKQSFSSSFLSMWPSQFHRLRRTS